MQRTTIVLTLAISVAGGWFARDLVANANAAPDFRYEVNNTVVHRFQDGGRTCYVASTGGISCLN